MSSQRVNIPTTITDEHYRYKMEKMITKVEGKGNGIKTVIVNMSNVARDLKVPPEYPTKYFGNHFGALSKFDTKEDRAIVNGKHDYAEMESALNDFIRKFVLCKKCNYPETDMSVDSKQNIVLNCKACGHVAYVDPIEKLCKFILANPPTKIATGMPARGATQQAAAAATEQQEETAATTTKKGKKKSAEEEWEGAAEEGAAGEEPEINPPTDVLKAFLKERPDASDSDVLKAVKKIQKDYELTDQDVVCLMFEAFFDENIEQEVAQRAGLIKRFVKQDSAAQKIILAYLEEFVGKTYKDLLKRLPLILEKFYDHDLIDEETILDWHPKKKSKFVKSSKTIAMIKEAAKPFVEWLQNAEVEDA